MATNILKSVQRAGIGKTLAVTAAFSIPAAAVVGLGWVMYRSGRAVRRRLSRTDEIEAADVMRRLEEEESSRQRRREQVDRRAERELEEAVSRLQKAHREFEVR